MRSRGRLKFIRPRRRRRRENNINNAQEAKAESFKGWKVGLDGNAYYTCVRAHCAEEIYILTMKNPPPLINAVKSRFRYVKCPYVSASFKDTFNYIVSSQLKKKS